MKVLSFICVICLLVPFSTLAHADGVPLRDYWTLQEYFEINPGEEERSAAFEALVAAPGVPLALPQDGPPLNSPVDVLIVYPGLQASDYWRRSVASFEARMKELEIDYNIRSHFTRPGTDITKQSKLIGEALVTPPDYLVFTLDALRHRGLIERVMARGKTKIILQNITTPLKDFGDEQPFLYVGFDHVAGTGLLVDHYKKLTNGQGSYALFYGPKGYVSIARGETFRLAMAAEPGMNLVASYYVGFDRQNAYEAAMEVLKETPEIDFFYACSTDIAIGIIDALKETGKLDDVLVNGWGGGSNELAAIQRNEMNFTVMRLNDDNGVAMAEAIKMDLEGKTQDVPRVFSGAFALVDQSTTPERLSELQAYAFRYSN
ncbi:substrate-binding domain-containing protein [Rhodovibrionaceae bacterium A322]